jgi:hypothetical protein
MQGRGNPAPSFFGGFLMADIYQQHAAAFSRVSAYVIMRDGERVATIAFKFPADGAGRLYAYVHYLSATMARGFAGGYGYDKRSHAAANAARNIAPVNSDALIADLRAEGQHAAAANIAAGDVETNAALALFCAALEAGDGGLSWDRALRNEGFDVLSAV